MMEAIAGDTSRAVWEQALRIVDRLDYLARGRPERAAIQAHARARLRPVFDRLGWTACVIGIGLALALGALLALWLVIQPAADGRRVPLIGSASKIA